MLARVGFKLSYLRAMRDDQDFHFGFSSKMEAVHGTFISGGKFMTLRYTNTAFGLFALGLIGLMPDARAAETAEAPQPGISADASAAIRQMSKALSADEFSFQARTIRVYQDDDGQPLHVFHTIKVFAHRPDQLAVHRTGDDGATDLFYDGKTVALFGANENKYARVNASNNIGGMLDEVSDRLNVDFPLADFLDVDPGKMFLSGVTSGKELGPVTIDGKPARHLFFSQAGGIELELWLDKTEQAAPQRLIVTYRLMPGQPSFIAEFSDWNFSPHLSDAEFVFAPPAGAKEVELQAAAPEKKENKQ